MQLARRLVERLALGEDFFVALVELELIAAFQHVAEHVMEGSYKLKLDQGDEKILTKGQTFYEAPGQLHAVSANASATEPAKVLAVIVAESGKPVTVPEKQ